MPSILQTIFALPLRALSWLGSQGTRAVAAVVFIAAAVPPLGALLRPYVTEAIFVLLCISFMRVDLAALYSHLRRPALVATATAWTTIGVPLIVGLIAHATGLTARAPGLSLALMLQSMASPMMAAPALAALMGLDATLVLITLVTSTALVPFTASLFAGLFLGDMLPFYDPPRERLPTNTRLLASLLERISADDDALSAMARIATYEGERARELQHRIDMARDVHDGVVQRLFGVSMALDAGGEFPPSARSRAAAEIQGALADLRNVVQRPLGRTSRPTGATLAEELARLTHLYEDMTIEAQELEVPPHLEPLAQSVLAESLRNADHHAIHAHVTVRATCSDEAFILEVANDGIRPSGGTPSTGMGLRLAAFEALNAGGFVEFGEHEGLWKVRLVVPIDDDS